MTVDKIIFTKYRYSELDEKYSDILNKTTSKYANKALQLILITLIVFCIAVVNILAMNPNMTEFIMLILLVILLATLFLCRVILPFFDKLYYCEKVELIIKAYKNLETIGLTKDNKDRIQYIREGNGIIVFNIQEKSEIIQRKFDTNQFRLKVILEKDSIDLSVLDKELEIYLDMAEIV